VQVGDSTATTTYNNGVIIDSGTCPTSNLLYYYNVYDQNCMLTETYGIVELLSAPSGIWYNDIYGNFAYELFGEAPGGSTPNIVLQGWLFSSDRCNSRGGGGIEFQ
jgi:hypothetical protein